MRLLTSLLPLLTALTATVCAEPSSAVPPSQHIFSHAQLPPSSWSPTHISTTLELGGSLTRSSSVYQLVRDPAQGEGGEVFVVGVKGAKGEGWVEASEGKGAQKKGLRLVAVGGDENTTYYSLPLSPSLTTTTLTLSSVLSHQSRPFPPSLPQNAETIYMLWEGDLLSPLSGLSREQRSKVEEVKVKVKTPTPRVFNAQADDGFVVSHSQGAALVTFTSKGTVADFEQQMAGVIYQQPSAVASIRKLDRVVELSHWGSKMAVQENIELVNSGPTLEGTFARIDHQKATMHRRQNMLAISSLTVPLPPSAHNPYYYDLVGNVSTSRFRPSPAAGSSAVLPSQKKLRAALSGAPAILELQPRYPLMGGWNYSFTIGYDLPLEEYVRARNDGKEGAKGRYVAAVPFLTPIRDVAVEEARVEVRLPEGARNIHVHLPFPVSSLRLPSHTPAPFFGPDALPRGAQSNADGTLVRTFLDSTGRPTVVMEKAGVTDRHGGEVIIEYDLPPLVDLLQKPLACATALGSIFLLIIGAKRLRWSIA
ncbi:hypothetical protein JCM6882_001367 [Rhodosporidiobolus microsporus]